MAKKSAKKKTAKKAAVTQKPSKKKATANKTAKKPAKKTTAKPAKKVAKKAVSKKTPAKKAVAKKKPVKKAALKAPAKKAVAKKVAKKSAKKVAKKPAKRASKKTVSATDLWNEKVEEENVNPAKTPFKAKDLKMFKNLLINLRDRIAGEVKFLSGDNLNRSQRDVPGEADQGTDNWDKEFALSMVSNEQDAIYEIEEAIRRIDEKTYGVCEITGAPIEIERLKAMPHTRNSLKAQSEIEKNSGRRYRHDPS